MPGITLKFLNGLIAQFIASIRTYKDGVESTPQRLAYNFKGSGVSVADNAGLGAKDVTIAGFVGDTTATPNTVAERDGSGDGFFAAVHADAYKFTSTGAAGGSLQQGAAAGGNGAPTILQAESGPAVGKTGGMLEMLAGEGHTPGTEASGGARIDVGTAVAGVSQPLSVQQGTTEFWSVQQIAAGKVAIASPAATVQLQTGGTLDFCNGATKAATWTLNPSGAVSLTIAAGATSVAYGQTQNATTAGVTTTYGAQQGAAGHAGGKTRLVAGLGGTPGTDAAGGIDLDVGQAHSGITSKLSLQRNTTEFAAVWQNAANITEFDLGTSKIEDGASWLTIQSGTGIGILLNAGPTQVEAITGQSNRVNWAAYDFQILNKTNNHQIFEAGTSALIGSVGDVIGLLVGAALNSTKLPAGTVDGGVFWGKANAVPTVGPDNTGNQLYVDPSTLAVCSFEHGGTLHHFTAYSASLGAAPSASPVTIKTPTARAKTSANTLTTIATILSTDIPVGSLGGARVEIHGRDTADDTTFQATRDLKWDKTAGGTLTVTSTTIGADRGAIATLTVDVSTDIRIRVTPTKNDDIRWWVRVHFGNCAD